jgi:hypothetical protein
MTPALIWKAVMQAAEFGMPAKLLERSPGPPVSPEPEEVAVTAFSDDPMQGSTFVTPVTSIAPPTPEAVISAGAPIIPAPPPAAREEVSPALAQTPQSPAVERMITRVPYHAYARAAPAAEPPSAPTEIPDTGFHPPSAAEADAHYRRQRELDYWQIRREATRPGPDEKTAYGGSEYRRQLPSDESVPYPPPRERTDGPN